MVDLLGGSLAELSQGTLEVGVVTALQDLREKLGALREALESIGAAHLGVHDALAQGANDSPRSNPRSGRSATGSSHPRRAGHRSSPAPDTSDQGAIDRTASH